MFNVQIAVYVRYRSYNSEESAISARNSRMKGTLESGSGVGFQRHFDRGFGAKLLVVAADKTQVNINTDLISQGPSYTPNVFLSVA